MLKRERGSKKELLRSSKKALFFDLDGTVIDSFPGINNGFQYAFKKAELPMPLEPVRNFIGPPLAHTMERLLNDKEQAVRMADLYREYYLDKGIYECAPYEGIKETLYELKNRGYHVYMATSKPTPLAKLLMEKFGLTEAFIKIYGAESDTAKFTKVQVLQEALSDSGEKLTESLMIGDTLWDREGAVKNNVDFAAVLYGFGSHESIDFPENYFTAETPLDILRFL